MPTQIALRFDEVPITCPTQQRYHAIAPCLAGHCSPADIARQLDASYATVTRWLREFRDKGLPGLFPATQYPREPYTPEKIIVTLVAYKCFAPKASARELAQVIERATGQKLHHETAGELLKRYFFWKYPEFRERLTYPVPSDPQARRLEMVKLHAQGWSEKRIADLLHCSRTTVYKWLRRWQQEKSEGLDETARLFDHSHAPQQPNRKVYFGTIHLVLTLQKKYGYAGWFRIKGYLERDYDVRLSETTIKKIMRLNRRVHLAPQRPIEIVVRDPREGPQKSKHPFEHVYTDIRYLDAKPEGIQLYSTLLLEGHSRTILAGSLTPQQDVGVVLHCYYLALLHWGRWEEVISDHGGQFMSHDFARVDQCDLKQKMA